MERKIGEIFKYNGEWYQCIVGNSCDNCAFTEINCDAVPIGYCYAHGRKDNKGVIFKKLEKVGEPYDDCGIILQRFKIHTNVTNADTKGLELYIYSNNTIGIEIKQNKENMKEKKLNMKPFDLEAAKAGKPVCTRDGRKARIICFDRKFYHDDGYNYPIVAMVNNNDNELVHAYTQDGLLIGNKESELDLMMLPEKKEGYINIYRSYEILGTTGYSIFDNKESAVRSGMNSNNYITTIKIEWEE